MDNSNPLFWFISFLDHLRTNVLEKFIIPGLGISWWHFVISLAVVTIVVVVLINAVRVGAVSGSRSFSKNKSSVTENDDV